MWFTLALDMLSLISQKAQAGQATIKAALMQGDALKMLKGALRALPMNSNFDDPMGMAHSLPFTWLHRLALITLCIS